MYIKDLVKELIKIYETSDPFSLAKRMGVQLLFDNLGETLGFYSKNLGIPFIHINSEADSNLQFFTVAHELGHVILHSEENASFLKKHTLYSVDKMEKEANLFALELLIQNNDVLYEDQLIHDYGVPEELITNYLYL